MVAVRKEVLWSAQAVTATKKLADASHVITKLLEFNTTGFSGTLDLQGSLDNSNWVNLRYAEVTGDGSLSIVNDQISHTLNTSRRHYLIAEYWPYVQIVMTRSAGSLDAQWWGIDGSISLVAGDVGDVNILSIAAGDNNIGNVDIASALPAGDNNIGNVDLASAIPAGTNLIGKVGIDQTTPGTTNRVDPYPAATFSATGEIAGAVTATVMPTITCKWVKFKAAYDNAGRVYIGGSGVTVKDGTTDATTGYELSAGEETDWLPVSNLNIFYRICNNAGDDLTYMVLN